MIKQRLKEFSKKKTEKELFQELCFCILTANTSAQMGIDTIDYLGDFIFTASEKQLARKLKQAKYRFYNKRAHYIIETRKKEIKLSKVTRELKGEELRTFLVNNVKGLGYKEASHFLRNIGFFDYAILDKHIINSMIDLKLIKSKPLLNKVAYLKLESRLRKEAEKQNISLGEQDLILWSKKTGKVLK